MTDTIITGRKFRVCVDSTQDKWNVISFWVKAQDVELDSGMNVQDFVTNINSQITGILSDSLSDSTDTAPTSRLLKDQITTLNNNFNNSVTGIFNKLKEYGYTPTNTSLDSIIAALTNMYNGRYKAGQDNVKEATLTTSNFNGTVSNGKYNIAATSAGYVPSGSIVHSLTARSINATIGVNGTYTIPSGYHDGTGKVKFSATPGTATATATAASGNVTVNLGATGYYDKVTINQTPAYNAGKTYPFTGAGNAVVIFNNESNKPAKWNDPNGAVTTVNCTVPLGTYRVIVMAFTAYDAGPTIAYNNTLTKSKLAQEFVIRSTKSEYHSGTDEDKLVAFSTIISVFDGNGSGNLSITGTGRCSWPVHDGYDEGAYFGPGTMKVYGFK